MASSYSLWTVGNPWACRGILLFSHTVCVRCFPIILCFTPSLFCPSPPLKHGFCTCFSLISRVEGGGGGGGGDGVLIIFLGGGVPPGPENPYPISDQKIRFSIPYFRPDNQNVYPISDPVMCANSATLNGFTVYGTSWRPKRCSCFFLRDQCLRQHTLL